MHSGPASDCRSCPAAAPQAPEFAHLIVRTKSLEFSHTGCFHNELPWSVCSIITDKPLYSGPGPVQGSPMRSMEGSQWVLPVKEPKGEKTEISRRENTMIATERRLKHPLIVTAMPQLVYARPTPRERYVHP